MALTFSPIIAFHGTCPANEAGKAVLCVHCHKELGVSIDSFHTHILSLEHECDEALLASQPGAPPPFN